MPKTIAYLRVSTTEQDLEKDKAAILHLANDKELGKVYFIEEKISGTISWKKRKIASIIQELQKNDSLIVSELSRIGRSMLEIMQVLSIALEKGINVYAVKGNWQLDQSIQSKIRRRKYVAAEKLRAANEKTHKDSFSSFVKAILCKANLMLHLDM